MGKKARGGRCAAGAGNRTSAQFGGTGFAGGYEIKVEGSAPIRFAVQADSAESNLEALNEHQFGQLGEVAHVVKWSPGAALDETLEKGRVGTEFWLPLALAAAVLGRLETLLAHWLSKSRECARGSAKEWICGTGLAD